MPINDYFGGNRGNRQLAGGAILKHFPMEVFQADLGRAGFPLSVGADRFATLYWKP